MTDRKHSPRATPADVGLWALSYVVDMCEAFWLSVLAPKVNEPEDDAGERASTRLILRHQPEEDLRNRAAGVNVDVQQFIGDPGVEETVVSDSSFLSQLEQRTQQVKITLANLEAEKTRIEATITRLQPLVPHYDALVEAERSINEANISLEETHPSGGGSEHAQQGSSSEGASWEEQHQGSGEGSGWSG